MATVRGAVAAHSVHPAAVITGSIRSQAAAFRVDPEAHLPLRRLALVAGSMLLFMRVGNIQQLQTYLLGINLPLLYVIAIPAIIGTILCGGLRRVLRAKPGYYWTAFALWLVLALPFSSWPGGSLPELSQFFRANLILFFVTGGLAVNWAECQKLMKAAFLGAIISVLSASLFAADYGGRIALEFGSIANSNDFAAHLLFCLAFLYWAILSTKRTLVKLLCLGALAYGVYMILATGSRGGLIALFAATLCAVVLGSMRQRAMIIVAGVLGLLVLTAVVPHSATARLATLFGSDEAAASAGDEVSRDAEESATTRKYLLQKSIEFTIQHPIFGVGLRQFANYEGRTGMVLHGHGSYRASHNGFTQIASENGVPALVFFVGGLLSAYRALLQVLRQARRTPGCDDIARMAICLMVCLVGYIAAFAFLNLGYAPYQSILVGMAVGVWANANDELRNRAIALEAAQTSPR